MNDPHLELVRAVHRQATEKLRAEGKLDLLEPATVPHTALPPLPSDHELSREWSTYRSFVAWLIDQGLEGAWVLVKNDRITGTHGRWEHAYIVALERVIRHELQPPFLIWQVRSFERVSSLNADRIKCPLSLSPLAQTA